MSGRFFPSIITDELSPRTPPRNAAISAGDDGQARGLRDSHDIAVERVGVFDAAIDGIKAAKAAGFLVSTNTTVFQETDMAELDELFAYLTGLEVDGFMISPGYSYSAVKTKEIFLTR